MPLGNARDSLANLQSLVQNDGNNEIDDFTKAPASNFNDSLAITTEYHDRDDSDYLENALIIDGDEDNAPFLLEDAEEEADNVANVPKTTPLVPIEVGASLPLHAETTAAVQDDSQSSPYNNSDPSRRRKMNRPLSHSVSSKQATLYSGFNYSDYYSESYTNDLREQKKNENILCCLFPFLKDPLLSDDEYSDDEEESTQASSAIATDPIENNTKPNKITRSPTAETEVPSDTDVHKSETVDGGVATTTVEESASAVKVTRLVTPPISIEEPESSDLALDIEQAQAVESPKPKKGILKRSVIKPKEPMKKERRLNTNINSSVVMKPSTPTARRSILPTYETSFRGSLSIDDSVHSLKAPSKSVSFSPMARVMPVLSRSEMSFFQRSMIWWQRSDYDDFKKTGRIIAKAMLEGGSDIWLQTSDAWGRRKDKRVGNNLLNLSSVNDNDEEKSADDEKWWCKFGHSRRGLEHIVTIQEGRQRQKLVNSSIAAVLEEQRRQRISRRDPSKIASISMQYTSWAKDLALAAGEADEDVVKSNFHSKSRCRLTFLRKKLLNKTGNATGPCASFILSANPALTAEVLDSHAHKIVKKKIINAAGVKPGNDDLNTEMKIDIAHKAAGFQFQEAKA